MLSIRKAVIPVAGMGTRMLPLTKSSPKEMLPLSRKPCLHHIVEELAAAGIKEVLFITGSRKTAIEDYFDQDVHLLNSLKMAGNDDLVKEISFDHWDISFFYTRQSVPAGLGDAVYQARDFVGRENFVVALGDSVITVDNNPMFNGDPVCSRSGGFNSPAIRRVIGFTGVLRQEA